VLEIGGHVEENGLHIIVRFVELVETVVGGGLVLQSGDDQISIYGLAAARTVLQYFLSFFQILKCFLVLFAGETEDALLVQLHDFVYEFFYVLGRMYIHLPRVRSSRGGIGRELAWVWAGNLEEGGGSCLFVLHRLLYSYYNERCWEMKRSMVGDGGDWRYWGKWRILRLCNDLDGND
jgi:hypothetical protein